MLLQPDNYSCGVAAVVNSLKCLGIEAKYRQVKKLAGTTKKNGTNEKGVEFALSCFGFKTKVLDSFYKKESLEFVDSSIRQGYPVIICVENWNHWSTVIGKIGDSYVIFDSMKTKKNQKQNGSYVLSRQNLLKYWMNNKNKKYFALTPRKFKSL